MITLQEISDILKSKGKFRIVFTGDSITSCEWVHPNWREIVEYVLKEEMTKFLGDWKRSEWGIRGFNFAYDGATTKDILDRANEINLVDPDLVICLMGSNDPTFNINISKHVENINKIIESLRAKVVWCNSTPVGIDSPKNEEYRPYAKASMEISENQNLQFIDIFNIYKDFPLEKLFTFKEDGEPDLTHPNQLGNAYIAKVILKEVFGISFDPEKYWKETLAGEKYPQY